MIINLSNAGKACLQYIREISFPNLAETLSAKIYHFTTSITPFFTRSTTTYENMVVSFTTISLSVLEDEEVLEDMNFSSSRSQHPVLSSTLEIVQEKCCGVFIELINKKDWSNLKSFFSPLSSDTKNYLKQFFVERMMYNFDDQEKICEIIEVEKVTPY